VAFATIEEHGLDFHVGEDVPVWPDRSDAALIGVYVCKQKYALVSGADATRSTSGVRFRLLVRPGVQLSAERLGAKSHRANSYNYLDESEAAGRLLDQMHTDLTGIVMDFFCIKFF